VFAPFMGVEASAGVSGEGSTILGAGVLGDDVGFGSSGAATGS
jgi:hypothetical protein